MSNSKMDTFVKDKLSTRGFNNAIDVWNRTLRHTPVSSENFERDYTASAKLMYNATHGTCKEMLRVARKAHS